MPRRADDEKRRENERRAEERRAAERAYRERQDKLAEELAERARKDHETRADQLRRHGEEILDRVADEENRKRDR